MQKNFYDVLGIDKKASKEDIKSAFRKLAHQYHPDKKGGNEAKFKEVNEAYQILSDEKKRAEYDTYGRVFSDGQSSGGGFDGGGAGFGGFDWSNFTGQQGTAGQQGQNFEFDLGDIFGDFFGGGQERTKRGRDISIDTELPFEEAIFGTERQILLNKSSVCDICSGSGAKPGTEHHTCKSCNGKGKVHEARRSLLGTFSSVKTCDVCFGRGKIPKDKCGTCHGAGISKRAHDIRVKIPAGIDDGEMIRLSGAGEAIQGGMAGDLYVKVHVKSHALFTKEGTNLTMDLDVKLSNALLGFEQPINTLDGEIKVSIPAGVSFGEILRVKGKGVPIEKNRRGDLLIKINILLPNKLSRTAREKIEELRNEGL
jgi:molecular chaperone DnaJ